MGSAGTCSQSSSFSSGLQSKVRFLWVSRLAPIQRKLSFNIAREVCSYLHGPPLLLGIYKASLRTFGLSSEEMKEATLTRSFSGGLMCCALDWPEVLCMGNLPPTLSVFSLDLRDNTLTEMQPMLTARGFGGVIREGFVVYVFGGYDGNVFLTSSEKYSLASRTWISLPNMRNRRGYFTPCLFGGEVYLADPNESHGVLETFSVVTEEFKTLQIAVPSLDCHSIAFIVGEELIILVNSAPTKMCTWKIKSTESNFQVSEVANQGAVPLSISAPVRVNRQVYWTFDGNLQVLDLEGKTARKV